MSKSQPGQRQRNWLHNHPLLRKGGKHEKSRKAQRKRDKQHLRATLCKSRDFSQAALAEGFLRKITHRVTRESRPLKLGEFCHPV